ncbi:MAG: methyltransferase [Pseudomonadota bacterium]
MTDRMDRSERVATAFGRAPAYESAARVQRRIAATLADRLGGATRPARPRVLELGCGTGFLTEALLPHLTSAEWTISDLSPQMVERARTSLGPRIGTARWLPIDGERLDPALGPFDLIVSSMAFQWFEDLPAAIGRLSAMLAPGGLLAFATMADGSFREWTSVLGALGRPPATPAYPTVAQLEAMVPGDCVAAIDRVDFVDPQQDARSFLRDLKAIGAGTPAAGYRPLPPALLREAMIRFDAGPRSITYAIAFCLLSVPRA